jgi:hypothetical protein
MGSRSEACWVTRRRRTNCTIDKTYSTRTFSPRPSASMACPNTRWWAFEDGKTNFGDIRPGTNEIAKLLLIEFRPGLRERLVHDPATRFPRARC